MTDNSTAYTLSKESGFKSMAEAANIYGCSTQHLRNLGENDIDKLKIILIGSKIMLERSKAIPARMFNIHGATIKVLGSL